MPKSKSKKSRRDASESESSSASGSESSSSSSEEEVRKKSSKSKKKSKRSSSSSSSASSRSRSASVDKKARAKKSATSKSVDEPKSRRSAEESHGRHGHGNSSKWDSPPRDGDRHRMRDGDKSRHSDNKNSGRNDDRDRGRERYDRERDRGQNVDRNRDRGAWNNDRHRERDRDRNNERRPVEDRRDRRPDDDRDRKNHQRRSPDRRRSRSPRRPRNFPRRNQEDHSNYEWGKNEDSKKDIPDATVEKEKPNFGLSGKLAEDTNKVNGVVIKYSEPLEARKPKRRWRLYPFKGEKALPTMYIHRQSCFLVGRDRKVCDLPVDHPSCSKQHAALQYRLVPFEREDGSAGKRVRPYLIDLESANGTFINNKKVDARKYIELLEKDVIKFGFSSREYVLLHENSKEDQEDDDIIEGEIEGDEKPLPVKAEPSE